MLDFKNICIETHISLEIDDKFFRKWKISLTLFTIKLLILALNLIVLSEVNYLKNYSAALHLVHSGPF